MTTKTNPSLKTKIFNWLQQEGNQSPLLLNAYDNQTLQTLIDETIKAGRDNRITDVSDIIITDTDKKTITIKQIRELIHVLSLTPAAKRRLTIIHNAHRLSIPAANALLKSLEEAPEYARFLLTTPWPSRLPSTIISRCIRHSIQSETSNTKQTYQSLNNLTRKNQLDMEDIELVGELINAKIKQSGPNPGLKMAATRLVEYYRIKESKGNEKLAREMLTMYIKDIV